MALLAVTVGPISARAANLGVLRSAAISHFQQEDVDLIMKNAHEVLDSADSNAKQSWSNPRTGASRFAQVMGQFATADGARCKHLRVFNKAKGGIEGERTYPVCKQ